METLTLFSGLELSEYFQNIPHYLCTCKTGMAFKLPLEGNFTSTNASKGNIQIRNDRKMENNVQKVYIYI
jgi:hypothetical protein